jgi:hypothetical protein
MVLEKTEARNDCDGEDQQQFNRPFDRQLVSQSRVAVAEAGDISGTQRKGTSDFRSRYQDTGEEDTAGREEVYALVNCKCVN